MTFLSFPSLDSRKVNSNNMLERLNKEIRRRTRVVGIFPNPESYLRLVTVYLMEYSEDWSVARSYLSEEPPAYRSTNVSVKRTCLPCTQPAHGPASA